MGLASGALSECYGGTGSTDVVLGPGDSLAAPDMVVDAFAEGELVIPETEDTMDALGIGRQLGAIVHRQDGTRASGTTIR